MGVLEWIGTAFIVVGCVFALTGSVGVLRMPDFYSRLHPAGKSDTLAQGLILLGLACFASQQMLDLYLSGPGEHGQEALLGLANIVLKLALLVLLLFVTAPTSTHAISKAARLDRYTDVPIEGDPARSLIAEIVVPGDVDGPLEESRGEVFDVADDNKPDKPESDTREDGE